MQSCSDVPKIRSLGFAWKMPLDATKEKGVGRCGNSGQMRYLGGGGSKHGQKDGSQFNGMSGERESIGRGQPRTPHGGGLVYLSQVRWLNDDSGE